MNVSEALNSRYTCRAFKADPVARETLTKIFDDALRAPSWANTQPWEIYIAGGQILEDLRQACLKNFHKGVPINSDMPRPGQWPAPIEARMRELGAARFKSMEIEQGDQAARMEISENNHRFFGAPVVAYLCMDHSLSSWSIHDLGMMSQSIMLAAQDRGVASAIAFNLVVYPDLIRSSLAIPDELDIIIGIALGYDNPGHKQNKFRSPRRPVDEVVRMQGI